MKNMIIIILLALCCAQANECQPCNDEARKAHDSINMMGPTIAIGLGGALVLAGANHWLGYDKKIDDGWFIAIPLVLVTYEFGNGLYHSARVGIELKRGM